MSLRTPIIAALTASLVSLMSACTTKDQPGAQAKSSSGAIQVVSTNKVCDVSTTTAGSGNLVFDVRNDGPQVTEFYLLAADGLRIVGEVENIGPGITRKLVTTAAPGSYVTACKPGMAGQAIRAEFTVTDSGADLTPSGKFADQLTTATNQYGAYIKDQADQLLVGTEAFVNAYKEGNNDAAREAYAPTRMHWERIEPVAESFGDLDPRIDLREADLEAGQSWTGWHRIEKDLWPPANSAYKPLTADERATLATQLLTDTKDLRGRITKLTYTPSQLGNGAKELLDEVATRKVTGEEEIWSHTDLWDFQANLDGARIAFEVLETVVKAKDAELATTLVNEFAAVQTLLNTHKSAAGFKLYSDLNPTEIKALADAVNALGEPLSKLTSTVVL